MRSDRSSFPGFALGVSLVMASGCVVLGLDFDKDGVAGGAGATGSSVQAGAVSVTTASAPTSTSMSSSVASSSGTACNVAGSFVTMIDAGVAEDTRIFDLAYGGCDKLALGGAALDGVFATVYDGSGAPTAPPVQLLGDGQTFFNGVALVDDGTVVGAGYCAGVVPQGDCACDASGGYAAYVAKSDPENVGACRWGLSIRAGNGANDNLILDVATDAEATYVAGFLRAPSSGFAVAFGDTMITLAHGSRPEGFVAKLVEVPGGVMVSWVTLLEGSGDEVPYRLALDASGVHVVGFYSSGDFIVKGLSLPPAPSIGQGFLVALERDNGFPLFARAIESTSSAVARDVAILPDGDVVVGGTFRDNVKVGTQNVPESGTHGFVARFHDPITDAEADLYTTHGGPAEISAVGVDASGRIAIAGTFGNGVSPGTTVEVEFGGGAALSMAPSADDAGGDVFVGVLEATFAVAWLHALDPTTDPDAAVPVSPSLAVAPLSGDVFLSVESDGDLLLDGAPVLSAPDSALFRFSIDGTGM